MKKSILLLLLLALSAKGFCTIWTITGSSSMFTPDTLTINFGDTVDFNVNSFHRPLEVSQATWNANDTTHLPGFNLPFGGGMVLPAQLTPGTHYYVCSAHISMGMKGVIIVKSVSDIPKNNGLPVISIYPNPSHGIFKLETDRAKFTGAIHLKVYDIRGLNIFEAIDKRPQYSFEIDLSHFDKGIYYLNLSDGTELIIRKIIIQ